MSWKVLIHPLVEKDFKSIPQNDQKFILKTCIKKLSTHPDEYGKPLSGPFHTLWKLKIRHYRVIYQINKKEIKILVVKVGYRRDDKVYKDLGKILKKI